MSSETTYLPGMHFIADLHKCSTQALCDKDGLENLWDKLIIQHQLSKIGSVFHQFDSGGYTGIICLTESHFSVHTWPEYGRVTMDIFLSNFLRSNDKCVELIAKQTMLFFDGVLKAEHWIKR